jgi:UDP-hydrolysing UDP-N-acetyl-D-glucosamine 2-epimerase
VKNIKRKICVISSNRADYSHLYPLLFAIKKSNSLDLKLIVTGTHLMKKYGETFKEFEDDGFKIDAKIKVAQNNSGSKAIIKSMSIQMNSAHTVLSKLKPDIIVILGDRYDIYPIAICSNLLNIPIAHFHGGEVTMGAIDDNFRHSISKMSHLHFVADDVFKKRLIKMGENPKNIYNVGSIGNLGINKKELLNKKQINEYFEFTYENFILISLHPETINENNKTIIDNILKLTSSLKNVNVIFTSPNSDTGSDILIKKIKRYVSKNKDSRFIKSAGRNLYLSLLKNSYCIIGNSSSCLIEAPYLNTPAILIGNRQLGRPISSNIILSDYRFKSLRDAYLRINSKPFIKNIQKDIKYLPKNSLNNILNRFIKTDIRKILYKGFHDGD